MMRDPVRTTARRRRTRWIALAAAASLLAVSPALAQTGAWGRGMGPTGAQADGYRGMPGMRGGAGVHGRFMRGVFPDGAAGAPFAGADRALHALPLGTVVTVETFGADPAEGAGPDATLTLTVGEDSEAAFAEQVAAAREDAGFLRTTVGARTRRIELAEGTPFPGRRGATPGALSGAMSGAMPGMLGIGGLDEGQTVTVDVFAALDDAAPRASLTFRYGVDSAAAFHAELQDALDGAAAVEVRLPERVRTVDLGADAARGPGPFGGRSGRR